jgi:hypothetical protein
MLMALLLLPRVAVLKEGLLRGILRSAAAGRAVMVGGRGLIGGLVPCNRGCSANGVVSNQLARLLHCSNAVTSKLLAACCMWLQECGLYYTSDVDMSSRIYSLFNKFQTLLTLYSHF